MIEEFLSQKINKSKSKNMMTDLHEFPGPDYLKGSPEIRFRYSMEYNLKILYSILKNVGEQFGYEKAAELLDEAHEDYTRASMNSKAMKSGVEFFKKMSGDDPTIVAATMLYAFDYLLGNFDSIDEERSAPGKTWQVNDHCKVWESLKHFGIEHKLSCEKGCILSIQHLAKVVDPKMTVGRQGKNHYEMEVCRCRGDETCEWVFRMEE